MAKYLLTIARSGLPETTSDAAPPADYLVEWTEDTAPYDGLERWTVDLQIAGTVSDWAKGSAYDAFWTYLSTLLQGLAVRPRGSLSIQSRIDPHRVAATFDYLGDHEVRRAREDLRKRIAGVADPASRRLKGDIDLQVHA